jgi:hypothetical protein
MSLITKDFKFPEGRDYILSLHFAKLAKRLKMGTIFTEHQLSTRHSARSFPYVDSFNPGTKFTKPFL